MLSEKDKQFLIYWEKVREKEAGFGRKLISGLPMSFIFSLPILLFMIIVKVFMPLWYMRAEKKETDLVLSEWSEKFSKVTTADFIMVIIAVMLIVLFYAYFRKHFKL
jgi:Na+/H+ antiporter NhaC